MSESGPLCDIHRCPLYGPLRGHSEHQPSELSARPPALAIGLPVALLGGLSVGAAFCFSNSRWPGQQRLVRTTLKVWQP
jgi:hypothetical protein